MTSGAEGDWVYRLFDRNGALLYVGFTSQFGTRFTAHVHEKEWWPEVAGIQLERQLDRSVGLRAERIAILREQPRYNIARYQTVDGVTGMKSFRIPEDVYRSALDRAKERGETLTDVVRRALEEYGK